MNVADFTGKRGKGDDYCLDPVKIAAVAKLIDRVPLIILVGRVAQRAVLAEATIPQKPPPMSRWRIGKVIGIPHPSGRNRQLNGAGDRLTQQYVWRALAAVKQ